VTPTARRIQRELGAKIRRARTLAGLTQEAVAAASGIDYKRYQRLEQGTVNATVGTLARVAGAIGVDMWQMLGDPGTPSGRK
jgi:transcriptional regulator with XRE-family HTH domain